MVARAVLVAAYWFAYLHTGRGFGASTMISTLMIGTLYALPVAYLWLRRGLETAMSFHFCQDFVRWGVAYLINSGFWP
jgi:membrane protease YdiL (CAAX protease family)